MILSGLKEDVCRVTILHSKQVNSAKAAMLDASAFIDLSDLFTVLGDPTRLKIIQALRTENLCVCDISAVLSLSQSAVSHQLRVLKQARLVKYKKEGKVVTYSLDDEHISQLFELGLSHIRERGVL